MKEIGIDISKQYSKSIDELPPKSIVGIDYIITLCAEEVCPIMVAPKAKKIHWPFPDPATKRFCQRRRRLRRFREARDAIQKKLKEFKLENEK